jgi:uncharacterized protein
MRVIFDTNVLVSAMLRSHSTPNKAVQYALANSFRVLASEATLLELLAIATRTKFDRYTSPPKRDYFVKNIASIADIIPITRTITLCRDPKDNKFLELAVCGAADYLITGDDDLLALHPFEATSILTPAQFLAIITA